MNTIHDITLIACDVLGCVIMVSLLAALALNLAWWAYKQAAGAAFIYKVILEYRKAHANDKQ